MLRQPNGFFVGFTLRPNFPVRMVIYRILVEKPGESGNSNNIFGFYCKNINIYS